MSKIDEMAVKETRLGVVICWGIIIGSLVGLFSGIFWFEMGMSLLFGTSSGLIFGSVSGAIVDNKSKSNV